MAPPAKRRKRNVVASDDEETKPQVNTLANYLFSSPVRQQGNSDANESRATSASPSPVSRKTTKHPIHGSQPLKPSSKSLLLRSNTSSGNGKKSASSSPQKPRSRSSTKAKSEEKGKTADLRTLFSKQAERAPAISPTKFDDIISDPISDDDDVGEHRAATASRIGNNARMRFKDGTQNASGLVLSASQRFLKAPRPPRDPALDDDQRPWSERFGPLNLEELVVHKKKVADVRRWLEDVMAGRMRQRLLILKGAAGTGKTTTVRLLAKDMRCDLLEWRNPTTSGGLGFQSVSAQFEEFMGRGGKFGQLDTDLEVPSAPSYGSSTNYENARRIIVIEEFPNTFTRSSSPLQSFRNTVMQYLATNTPSLAAFGQPPSKDPITPVVMVISETLLTTTSASADSFTAHRLLGPEITRHPGTAMIEFNPVAPTLLANALELIVQKEARKSGRRRTPGPMVLKRLGEIGDIRSAVSSLEFLCLKGDNETDWGSTVAAKKPKRGAKIPLTKDEGESLELISQREASLGIFHAVGKVVYNKRDEAPISNETGESRVETLPGYLAHHSRPKRSEVSVDNLIDETGTDTHTFISALHENYILSCESTEPADLSSSIDYVNECIEYLSESDLLCPSSDIFFGGRGSGSGGFSGRDSGSYILRQDEITFQVATRGLLFSLPHPVKRIGTTSSRGGGDAFKMFYPTSLKQWREKEELEGVVDLWSTRLLRGEESAAQNLTDGASAFRKPKPTNSGDWLSKQASSYHGNSQCKSSTQGQDLPPPLLSLGSSARRELLLERLPYMTHIARRKKSSFDSFRLRDLEKVVSFSGIHGAGDEEAAAEGDETNADGGEAWATDKPTEESSSPRKKSLGIRQKNDRSVSSLPVQQLVLSDDDIEDD